MSAIIFRSHINLEEKNTYDSVNCALSNIHLLGFLGSEMNVHCTDKIKGLFVSSQISKVCQSANRKSANIHG